MGNFLEHYEAFFDYFNSKFPLTESEQLFVQDHLSVKKLRKKQYLLQDGDTAKNIAFVGKGLLRSYTVDDNGVEHILDFAPEGWFISDLYSFLTGESSIYNIDAIEDSELVLISKASHELLLKEIPKYLNLSYEMILESFVDLQRRTNSQKSESIEEQYECFVRNNKQIINRIPQYMIASFLGLTPETLSRIRKRMA